VGSVCSYVDGSDDVRLHNDSAAVLATTAAGLHQSGARLLEYVKPHVSVPSIIDLSEIRVAYTCFDVRVDELLHPSTAGLWFQFHTRHKMVSHKMFHRPNCRKGSFNIVL